MLKNTLLAAVVFASANLAPTAQAQRVEEWVTGMKLPVDMVVDPTTPDRFYVAEQKTGRIRVIEDGKLLDEPFLSIDRSTLVPRGWEQGLLGLEFSPNFADDKHIYVNYTGRGQGGTFTYISRFTVTSPTTADPDSEHVVLMVKQPYGNHNCGNLRFGPDGFLYIGLGDGGSGGDPLNSGQDRMSLLGTILRIDVMGDDFPDDDKANYSIPKDNPFVDDDEARDEIYAWGIRNPWGMEFDSKGNLWIADVGQNAYEEVDIIPAGVGGLNFGWRPMEGLRRYRKGNQPVSRDKHRENGFEPPVWDYPRSYGGSITGGFLYEGSKVPALKDRYICADFMSGRVWSFKLKGDAADDVVEHTAAFKDAFPRGMQTVFSAFAKDHDNELYVLDHRGGRVLKIVP